MRYPILIVALSLTLALTACGGSSSHDEAATMPPDPGKPPVITMDAFYSAVLATVGNGDETAAEPQAIEMAAATMPEDSEPIALK